MRLALCQFDIRFKDIEYNLRKIREYVLTAKKQQADLIAFPESCLAGYCYRSPSEAADQAMTDTHEAIIELQQLAHKEQILIVAGYIEKAGETLYNTAAFFGLTGKVEKYRKAHTLLLGLDRFVAPGDLGFPVFETEYGKIGLNICYDQRFPESARMTMLNGAQLILTISNIPRAALPVHTFLTKARAFENKVFYGFINRVGIEEEVEFVGQTSLIDPYGNELVLCSDHDEQLVIADIDLGLSLPKKTVFRPLEHEIDLLGDRRPDLYKL